MAKSGIELEERDPELHPGDDLYLHMNGRWIERSDIPADKARYGAFTVLAEEAEKAVLDIIERSGDVDASTEAGKVGDLYASFMDEKHIEDLGHAPLLPLLEEVSLASSDKDAFAAMMGRLERQGVSGLWQLFVDNDPGDPQRYVVFLEQGQEMASPMWP